MERNVLLDVLSIIYLFFVGSHCSGLIESQRCLHLYDENGFLFNEDLNSYKHSISYCSGMQGKPPMPTERSWEEFLKYIRLKHSDTEHQNEGIWIGVTVTSIEDTKFSVVDSDNTELDNQQTRLLFSRDLEEFRLNGSVNARMKLTGFCISNKVKNRCYRIGDKRCVTYLPPKHGNNTWYFDLQPCTEDRLARTACRCISDVSKYPKKAPSVDSEKNLPENEAQTDGASNSSEPERIPKGRANNNDVVSESHDTATNTSTPLAAILGLLAACCLIATTYIIAKKRGWNLRERIAQRMPYNRPRPSVNGGSYGRGQEMSEITVSENRPIHVYEEIIPRNSAAAHRGAILSSSSSIAMPHFPPPEPPNHFPFSDFTTQDERRMIQSIEDGYLQPSFRRKDTIPGDVRSPRPVNTKLFAFPPTNTKNVNLLQSAGQNELKYASVETVQTLLDGEQPTDEEYLVDDEENVINNGRDKHFGSLVVDIPDEKVSPTATKNNRNSVLNSYVQINAGMGPQNECEQCQASDSSPVFPHINEYENDRFLKTAMKAPPVKPKRRGKNAISPSLETQPDRDDGAVLYSRIPSATSEPLYSKVKRKEERNESCPADRFSAAYTPMKSDTFRRQQSTEITTNFTDSDFTDDEVSADESNDVPESSAHEYQKILNTENTFISPPQMISTTNRKLANSSLVCYEIPPEMSEDA